MTKIKDRDVNLSFKWFAVLVDGHPIKTEYFVVRLGCLYRPIYPFCLLLRVNGKGRIIDVG